MRLLRAGEPNRQIVWLDETWVNAGHTRQKAWEDTVALDNPEKAKKDGYTVGCIDRPSGKGERLIIVHAGSEQGFVPGAYLAYHAIQADGDYHREMNSTVFEQWFLEQLLPNLPSTSCIVMDNAKYHSRRIDCLPTSATRKADLQSWLTAQGINWTRDLLRPELYELAKARKRSLRPVYYLDTKAEEAGHPVIRLPPYYCEFNPIEHIWANVKNSIASSNTDYKLASVRKLLDTAIASISAKEWQSAVRRSLEAETHYWESDQVIDPIMDELIIDLENDSSSDSSSDED